MLRGRQTAALVWVRSVREPVSGGSHQDLVSRSEISATWAKCATNLPLYNGLGILLART